MSGLLGVCDLACLVQRGAISSLKNSEALGRESVTRTWGGTSAGPLPHTLAAAGEGDRLVAAVTNMAMSQPPLDFANRFFFTTDMVKGGQGIVVFARSRDAGMHQIAIKCASRDDANALHCRAGQRPHIGDRPSHDYHAHGAEMPESCDLRSFPGSCKSILNLSARISD
jgi:hypothetical protein